MDLHYCRIEGGNFGDDLNRTLWARLFPGIDRARPDVRLYGIGTILGGAQPAGPKVVLGSGLGYRGRPRPDPRMTVYWVRGPRTARSLGIDPALAIGDPALLWNGLDRPRRPVPGRVGLVPHFRSLQRFDWGRAALEAGVHLVDPRQPPDAVAAGLARCERVLCESLHGAICADAMGIPWRALVLARRFNDFKWRDWLDGVGMELRLAEMPVELLDRLSPLKAVGNALVRLVDRGRAGSRQQMRPLRAAGTTELRLGVRALQVLGAEEGAFVLADRARVAAQRDAMEERCAAFARDHGLAFAPDATASLPLPSVHAAARARVAGDPCGHHPRRSREHRALPGQRSVRGGEGRRR